MEKQRFWTWRRLTGGILILGSVMFLGSAGLIPTDAQGTFAVNLPLKQALILLAAHMLRWQWSLSLFISGVIVTVLGLALLTGLLRGAGDRIYSSLAFITFFFGAVLMVLYLSFPLGVDAWAAQETIKTGSVPSAYLPLNLWTNALFEMYTLLAFLALAGYGAAVLTTRVLPHWVGWTAILYGLAGLVFLGMTMDVPPFLHQLMPIVIGILLLLHPDDAAVPPETCQRQA